MIQKKSMLNKRNIQVSDVVRNFLIQNLFLADQSGIMVYLQIDVGMCRESYSNFDCFTNIENTASYLSAANAKKVKNFTSKDMYASHAREPMRVFRKLCFKGGARMV